MMRQYGELKRRFPDYLLLFRLGDFYELFFQDAQTASRLLQLTLTSRQKGEGAIPMAGIPHHAADGYIARLIRAGQKVAVCEQLEEPAKGRKIVRRDVVRVITPGTITDTQFLDGAAQQLPARRARDRRPRSASRSWTSPPATSGWARSRARGRGSSRSRSCAAPRSSCSRRARTPRGSRAGSPAGVPVTRVDGGAFGARAARDMLESHFRGASLDALGVGALTAGLQAAGAALAYLRETQGESLAHLTRIQRLVTGEAHAARSDRGGHPRALRDGPGAHDPGLALRHARRHHARRWARACSASGCFARCSTARPSSRRQEAVAALVDAPAARDGLRRRLEGVGDLERLTSRAALGVAHARDLIALRGFLGRLPGLAEALGSPGWRPPGHARRGDHSAPGPSETP